MVNLMLRGRGRSGNRGARNSGLERKCKWRLESSHSKCFTRKYSITLEGRRSQRGPAPPPPDVTAPSVRTASPLVLLRQTRSSVAATNFCVREPTPSNFFCRFRRDEGRERHEEETAAASIGRTEE
ncbi:hypothetical protein Q5P01_005860 [Channa striata]|uniref:Uncharacterized protein n=1 Tax=Channa striata TaxID=64152 RepID=A0AA88T1M5_CHASR|nr:hypothetical protein Q5P01_005860 [Channa striata]